MALIGAAILACLPQGSGRCWGKILYNRCFPGKEKSDGLEEQPTKEVFSKNNFTEKLDKNF